MSVDRVKKGHNSATSHHFTSSAKKGIVGSANVGALCVSRSAVAVTSLTPVFWLHAAHEFGHQLNATHIFDRPNLMYVEVFVSFTSFFQAVLLGIFEYFYYYLLTFSLSFVLLSFCSSIFSSLLPGRMEIDVFLSRIRKIPESMGSWPTPRKQSVPF